MKCFQRNIFCQRVLIDCDASTEFDKEDKAVYKSMINRLTDRESEF